jgi:hypothetical protein
MQSRQPRPVPGTPRPHPNQMNGVQRLCLWWGPGRQNPLAGFRATPLTLLPSPDCPGCPAVGQFEWMHRVGCGGSCQWTLQSPLWVESGPLPISTGPRQTVRRRVLVFALQLARSDTISRIGETGIVDGRPHQRAAAYQLPPLMQLDHPSSRMRAGFSARTY